MFAFFVRVQQQCFEVVKTARIAVYTNPVHITCYIITIPIRFFFPFLFFVPFYLFII